MEKVLEDPKKGKPLSYRFKGYWSIRIGKYRIIYEISGNKVIFTFKHRKRVYK
ncbi:MAG: type II toxin-antitoxin system RelE/ParE family toxin [Candidatus Hydrothermarchaeota archaeon]